MKHIVIAIAVVIAIALPHEVLCVVTTDITLSTYNWEPKPVRTIIGKVLTPDGKPAAGISIYEWSNRRGEAKEVVTDSEGRFSLEQSWRHDVQLTFHGGGFAPETIVVGKDDDSPIELKIKPGHSIKGRVINDHGDPIAGAKVSTGVYAEALTDKDGYFKLEALPAGETSVNVTVEGYAGIYQLPLKADTEDNLIELETLGQICGTVLDDATGKPVPKFRLRLDSTRTRLPGDKNGVLPPELYQGIDVQSSEGHFRLSNLIIGSASRLTAEAPGYQRCIIRRVVAKQRLLAHYKDHILRLQPAYTFRGSITDAADGRPLQGVDITILDTANASTTWMQEERIPDNIRITKVQTNAEGKFQADNLVVPVVGLVIEKTGYARTILKDVRVEKPFSLALPFGARIRGVMPVEPGSKPTTSSVSINAENPPFRRQIDAKEGRFELGELAAGSYYIYSFQYPMLSRLARVDAQPGGDYEVDWNAPAPAELEGSVTFRGTPAVGALIFVSDEGSSSIGTAKTDKDGRYKTKILSTGLARVSASLTLETPEGAPSLSTHIREKPTLNAGPNHLDIQLPGGSISGVMIDQKTNAPVHNSTVRVYRKQTVDQMTIESRWSRDLRRTDPQWSGTNTFTTGPDGKFRFEGLVAGDYMLACTPSRKIRTSDAYFSFGTLETAAVHGPAFHLRENEIITDITLELPALASLEVRAEDKETGDVISYCEASLTDDQGFIIFRGSKMIADTLPATTGKGSRLVPVPVQWFNELKPGRYTLSVQDDTHLPYRTSVTVKQDEATKLTVRLERAQKVVFRLKEPANDLIPLTRWQIGYKIIRSGESEPIREDSFGSYWGGVKALWGDTPRQLAVPVPPGKYDVEMMLARGESRNLQEKDIVWTGKAQIRIMKDKDSIVDIPLPKIPL